MDHRKQTHKFGNAKNVRKRTSFAHSCHFCFQHFAAQFSEHQKAAYTRYVLCAAISIPFFAHILPSRIFFSILYFFPLQILHECAKEVRLRTFFAFRICAFVFCDPFSILHVFPYNFVATVCNIYKSAQIASIYARFSVIFVRCGVKLFPVLCTNCFVLVRMF